MVDDRECFARKLIIQDIIRREDHGLTDYLVIDLNLVLFFQSPGQVPNELNGYVDIWFIYFNLGKELRPIGIVREELLEFARADQGNDLATGPGQPGQKDRFVPSCPLASQQRTKSIDASNQIGLGR